ncbi:MAG: CotH kinase family protein [Huintestinicola sp.]
MKKYQKFLSCTLALCLLTACSETAVQNTGADSSVSSSPDTSETAAAVTEEIEIPPAVVDGMAVLSIVTRNRDENVMDFITEPVNSYVSHSIASWTPGYVIPPEPYYEDCVVKLTGADETVLLDTVNAQVKVRGNWTTSYDKKPLRIKFEEKQSMLGLNGGEEMKNWVLLAEYKDGSMLRNKTALSAAREILGADGLYAADAEFVEVTVNGKYWGVYLLTEYQQADPARIDITENPADHTGTDIGYFMEFDGYYTNEDELHSFSVDYADNAPLIPFDGKGGSGRTITCLPEKGDREKKPVGISIKSDINSQEQHDFIQAWVNNVYRIMYSAAYEDKAYVFNEDKTAISLSDISPREAVELAVDVDSLADMYIVSELTCDADIYWSSFFMDADFGENGDKKLHFEAPWDFDSSMGNKNCCPDGRGFYAANIVYDVNGVYETVNPWLAVLMNEEWFTDIIREKWTAAYDSGVFERASQLIENDRDRYANAFDRNYLRWDNLVNNQAFAGELSSGAASCRTHAQAADHLNEWFNERVRFLNDYWHMQ